MIVTKSKHADGSNTYETTIEQCCKQFEKISYGFRDWSIRMMSGTQIHLYIGEKCYGNHCPFCYAPVNIIERKKL